MSKFATVAASDDDETQLMLLPGPTNRPDVNRVFWSVHTGLVLLVAGGLWLSVAAAGATRTTTLAVSFVAILLYFIIHFQSSNNNNNTSSKTLMLHACVVYELALLYIVAQTPGDARQLLAVVDPRLNRRPAADRDAGLNCDITAANLSNAMNFFVASHIFGWIFKTLILRDVTICVLMSFLFEVLEYALRHQLPVFSECWWDQVVVDFTLSNGLGIYVGMCCYKAMGLRAFDWSSLYDGTLTTSTIARVRGAVAVTLVTGFYLIWELNTFYLKHVLWIPTTHALVLVRLPFLVLWGAVATREVYDYLRGSVGRMGDQLRLTCLIIVTEMLVVVKFGAETIFKDFPGHVRFIGGAAAIAWITWLFWVSCRRCRQAG